MPRPRKPRLVRCDVSTSYFKPRGIPLRDLEEVTLSVDGLEALRLADAEGLDQVTAAAEMGGPPAAGASGTLLLAESQPARLTATRPASASEAARGLSRVENC